MIKDGINVLILGKPNVGKSTILNGLIEDDKAIISDIPGTTRDVLEDTVTIGGNLLRFIDTAGIRETEDKIEKIGIKKALNQIDNASLILYIIDLNNTDTKSLNSEINSKFLKNKNVIYVGNKADLKIEKDTINLFKKNNFLMISCHNLIA